MNADLNGLLNKQIEHDAILSDNSPQTSSLLTPSSLLDRGNIKHYSQWVNTKFAPAGFMTKLSAKVMAPFCANPVIGIVLLVGWIVFFIYITWYISSSKCANLDEPKLQQIAKLIAEAENAKLDLLATSITSSFRAELNDMINEQTMYAMMSENDKKIYLAISPAEKSNVYNKYLVDFKKN